MLLSKDSRSQELEALKTLIAFAKDSEVKLLPWTRLYIATFSCKPKQISFELVVLEISSCVSFKVPLGVWIFTLLLIFLLLLLIVWKVKFADGIGLSFDTRACRLRVSLLLCSRPQKL